MMERRISAGLLVGLIFAIAATFSSWAATSERIVRDPNSGVALYGYDPVAYFIDKSARQGDAQYEFRFAGLTWRFRSEANRAAFAQTPENFVPVFGGYDPVAVGEGVPIEGNPAIFAVSEGKLFLFAREESLGKFIASPKSFLETAEASWPLVKKKLVP